MTNTSLLKECIKKSGYKISHLAKCLGITEHTLSRKINNKNEFQGAQIDALCKLLDIDIDARMAIFFAE